MEERKLGVIGGLGPMATALFMQMVVEMTDADKDQEHIEMYVHHCPKIPDRTGFILGNSTLDPTNALIESGQCLAKLGADLIVIPCVTSTFFYDNISKDIPVPVLNIVTEIKKYLQKYNISSVGLMATTGTVKSGLFQEAFSDGTCELILPSVQGQEDVMHLIYHDIKANKAPEMDRFYAVTKELRQNGAQIIILGCTELSVIRKMNDIGNGYLDAMELMAKCAVEYCGKIKPQYLEIIH